MTGPLEPPSVGESGEALAPIAPRHLAWPEHFDTTDDVEAAWHRALATLPTTDRAALMDADAFGRERHHGQMRRGSDTPYWVHPVRVAMGIMQWGIHDREVLVGALLHDVVEDTITTPGEIRQAFGARVEGLVVWLTAPDAAGGAVRDYYRRLLAEGPPDAHLVKIADRSDNLRSIQALVMRTGDEHRRWAAAYLSRTQWQVIPLVRAAPSPARVALVTAMADLAPLIAPGGFTES